MPKINQNESNGRKDKVKRHEMQGDTIIPHIYTVGLVLRPCVEEGWHAVTGPVATILDRKSFRFVIPDFTINVDDSV